MVHALSEAWRVLKPNGILIDLRPAAAHRRVGLGSGRRWKSIGVMREQLDDDDAANRAVDQVIDQGLFQIERRLNFDLDRVNDTPEEFQAWLAEFTQSGKMPSHAWLYRRIDRALAARRGRPKVVVRGLMALQVLRKIGA